MRSILWKIMEISYYETKVKILALASAFFEGDAETRAVLSKKADFFPLARDHRGLEGWRSIIIRVGGQIFLVEDTRGGEKGVFALLQPHM